jgi:pimeloyl-ACP methyl ester carboxylesterase
MLLHFVERVGRRALGVAGLESRYIETPHARHHIYDGKGEGSLPTIVVLHGIGSSGTAFAPVLGRLLKHARRVVAPDAPGHGFSDPPRGPQSPELFFTAMTELLDQVIGDEQAIVCGNSLGGATALNYAFERPARVKGLFLTSPAGAHMEEADFKAFLGGFRMTTNAEARTFLRRLYHRTPWYLPLLAPDVKAIFDRPAVSDITALARAEALITPAQLQSLKMPIRFIWGRSERLLPPENLAFFKANLPAHAVVEEPEGFGHCPHYDAPGRLAAKIIDFARSI